MSSTPLSTGAKGKTRQPWRVAWAPCRRQRWNHGMTSPGHPPVLRPQSSLRSVFISSCVSRRQREVPCVPGSTKVLQTGDPGLLGLCALLSPFLSSLLSALSTSARGLHKHGSVTTRLNRERLPAPGPCHERNHVRKSSFVHFLLENSSEKRPPRKMPRCAPNTQFIGFPTSVWFPERA